MKKLLLGLFFCLIVTSCAVFYGTDMDSRAKKLQLGMTRQEVINIMGNDYYIESSSQMPEGNLVVLHYNATVYYNEYLIYLLDGELVEFHRYVPPPAPPVHDVRHSPPYSYDKNQ